MKRIWLAATLASLAVSCTSMGSGSGFVAPGNEAVSFSWKSADGSGTSGQMSATLADGKIFSGDYLEITRQAATPGLDPLWEGWDRGAWNGWPGDEPMMPAFGSSTVYSGRVLANLRAADGQRMRCRFHLNVPSQGMSGGGQGKCQLENSRSVDALFPRA